MARRGTHGQTVAVEGLRELLAEIDKADRKTKKLLRDDLREAAEPVRDYAAAHFARYDSVSASNFRISVRKTGVVSVEQRLRKTTGRRPDFGVLQMTRALIPGLVSRQQAVVARLEQAVERIIERIERAR